MILDTEFFISLQAAEPAAVELAAELEASGVPTRIPTIVSQELYIGVGAGDFPHDNARKYEPLIENKPVVDLDANISRRAGVLGGAAPRQRLEAGARPGGRDRRCDGTDTERASGHERRRLRFRRRLVRQPVPNPDLVYV
jgi:predicted nucleic acid-binding protein